MAYNIKLEAFEGPLDLLLHLIKKNQVNIYDIPITMIADQYLEYLEVMKALNLNLAGEFLALATTLLHIKSKMLLPTVEEEEEGEEQEDPRDFSGVGFVSAIHPTSYHLIGTQTIHTSDTSLVAGAGTLQGPHQGVAGREQTATA